MASRNFWSDDLKLTRVVCRVVDFGSRFHNLGPITEKVESYICWALLERGAVLGYKQILTFREIFTKMLIL